jgi:hypothetical protein
MGLEFTGMITPTGVPFYGIVHSKTVMPLGQITLPVTFGPPQTTVQSSSNLRLQTLNLHITLSLED